MAPRINAAAAAEMLGVSTRNVQIAAKQGRIPGAAMILGRWTFDPDALRIYIQEQEQCTIATAGQPRPTLTGAATPSGTGSWSKGVSYEEAYKRATRG